MKSSRSYKPLVILAAIILALSAAAAAVSCAPQQEEAEPKLVVAVTLLPLAEFAESIGGDKVEVSVMVPPGASPHSYEPTPSQMTVLSKAVLYAKAGSGVEFELAWMDKLIAQNRNMLVVDCSQDVQLQEMMAEDEQAEDGDGHEHGAMDPHIWMSPQNARIMAENIAEGLITVDPDNRIYYKQNRDSYLQELEQLDSYIRVSLAGVENRVFMVYHPAFGYFAGCYDLTMLPIEAEGKEPTPAGLQHLIEQAREHNIRVVFAEPQFNPQSAEVIAEAIGGNVVLIDALAMDYTDNLRTIAQKMAEAME